MKQALTTILEIQELDMQMIQLTRLKRQRQRELENLNDIKEDLREKAMIKEGEIMELRKDMRMIEGESKELKENLKKLEKQQSQVKKIDEFNALNQEMTQTERERVAKDQRLNEMNEKLLAEEEILKNYQEKLNAATESGKALGAEIKETINRINDEGIALLKQREKLAEQADPEVFPIYERLLRNKKDRVVVPIENRCCSGCHILLTVQDENMVRRAERIIFCEHCSRILYWTESQGEEKGAPTKRRRQRTNTSATAA